MTIDRSRKNTGDIGETIASKFLERRGFKILERNFRRPWGEIDIIAERGSVIRFVEVKTVSRESLRDTLTERDGYRPEEQVHPAKLRRLVRTAELYMSSKNDNREFQIDVVGVFLDHSHRVARCRLFEQVL